MVSTVIAAMLYAEPVALIFGPTTFSSLITQASTVFYLNHIAFDHYFRTHLSLLYHSVTTDIFLVIGIVIPVPSNLRRIHLIGNLNHSIMAQNPLSRRDLNVLEKMKDPESDPRMAVMIDPDLPKDPNVTDTSVYERVSQKEREIVLAIQQLEMELAGLRPSVSKEPTNEYRQCVHGLGQLISENPRYASARNNRAQALRRLYGDTMIQSERTDIKALVRDAGKQEISEAALVVLSDLDEAIALLTPKSLFVPISPVTGRTLSQAHTQRAAIYYMTSKSMRPDVAISLGGRKEEKWTKLDFESAASRDFALGGRYGNEIAKGLAVSTNPTAKLCGQIVREAMKKEYGPAFAQ